jgi:signal peptidase II
MFPLVIMVVIVVSDQVAKEWVRSTFTHGESMALIPGFFSLTYVRNTGAAWGMLGGYNTWLAVLSVVMLALMVIFRRTFLNDTAVHRTALGLMLGGILGNLLDRVRLNWVTDFLDFYVGSYHWPSFNIADAAICTGVGLYILTSWRSPAPAQPGRTVPL